MNRIPLVFCTMLAALLVALFLGPDRLHAQTEQSFVEVTQPRDGREVAGGMHVKGTAALPTNHHLWVLARRIDFEGLWWPQNEGKINAETGTWSVYVNLGGPQDIGWDFEIAIIVVKKNEHLILKNYRDTAMRTGGWNPIEAPPSAMTPQILKVKKAGHYSSY